MNKRYQSIIAVLRTEISRHDRTENRLDYQRFFKEKLDQPTGIKTPILRKVSATCYREVKAEIGSDLLDVCEAILLSGIPHARFFAFEWAQKAKNQYVVEDLRQFESWLRRDVDGWAPCDHLCCGALGLLLLKYPQLAVPTRKWTKSRNRWYRRASAVSLIVSVRKGQLFDEACTRADELLTDSDDLVQKGYGWLLKEASKRYRDEVFAFVMEHKERMPRTALRYAIEKLPTTMRAEAMRKAW